MNRHSYSRLIKKNGCIAGLSYTSFTYSGLEAAYADANCTVTVTVTNTGNADGADVVQVYATPPRSSAMPKGAPLQNLIGFEKVAVAKGTSRTVQVPVDTAQLETAMADGTRTLVPGAYTLSVGGHQPNDAEGTAAAGPTLTATIHVPWPRAAQRANTR